ncbi:MAG: cobalt transporter CbiM, partial [Planctomycetes bacterium]|nr:cobalt transporter CbiM [Planctomycetota bacterium]
MHIADGVLRPEVLIGGYAVAGLATAASIARFDERRIPQVAVLTSLFFVASLIHVPLGTTSVHLLLVGLLGIVLGRLSFPVVLVGLFLQALLLGHGGITTLGVNSVTMGSGALAASAVFETIGRAGRSRGWLSAVAFVASLAGTLVASAMYLGAMALGGRDLALVAEVTLIPNLVVSVLDGLVAASTVSFLAKVKPEVLGGVRARALAAIA